MALPVTITGISTAIAPVGPFRDNTLFAQNNTSVGTQPIGTSTASTIVGAPFLTPATVNPVTDFTMMWIRSGAPTDLVDVNLYAADASYFPTGGSLGTFTIDPTTLPTAAAALTTFSFPSPITVSSSSRYVITFQRRGGINGSNFIGFQYSSLGTRTMVGNNGSSWSTGSSYANVYVGSSQSRYSFFGRDSANALTLQVYKSTAPDTSWASVRTMPHANNISNIAGFQVGNIIHLLTVQALGAGVTTVYFTFDMSTDNFAVTGETVINNLSTTGQTGGLQYGASLVVRSTGEAVAFFNGLETKTSGTFRARVYYSRRTAVNTWSAAVQVDANTAFDNTVPEAVLGASNRVHLVWNRSIDCQVRTLSAANALSAAQSPVISLSTSHYVGVSSAAGRVVIGTAAGSLNPYFASADLPTINLSSAGSNETAPEAVFVDGNDFWNLYRNSTDSDLYARKSIDDGATWGTPVLAMTATVTAFPYNLSRDGNVYQSGNNIVLPYIVNDNGTHKYNEYTVRSLAPPMPELDLTVGAVAVAGPAITLRAARQLILGVGAVNVIGRDTQGTKGQRLTLQKGSVTLAGSTATLRVDRKIFPATYGVALAGKTAILRVGRKLQATAGAITLTGVDVNLRYGRGFMLTTQPGAVALAGKDVDLIYTPSLITAYVLQAGTGAITVAPTTAILRYGHVLTAQKGAVAVSGVPANVRRAYTLSQTVGALTLTGYPATLKYGRAFNFTAGVGAIAVSMKSATLRRNRMLSLATGSIAVTGIPADLKTRINYKLTAQPGAIVVTGNPAVLTTRSDKVLRVLPGAITLTGQDATLKPSRALPIVTGAIRLTGYPVILDHHIHMDYTMELAPAAVVVAGQYAELKHGNLQPGQITYGRRAYIPGRW
jgi:hypothetical protein